MCSNSANLTPAFDEANQWYCVCQGNVGMVFIIISSSMFLVVGTPLLGWSLWVSLRNLKPSVLFLLNLSILDLLYCFLCFIELIFADHFSVSTNEVILFLIGLNWTVRPLIQICMSIEQYLAVIHPVIFLRYRNMVYRIAASASSWLLGFSNSLRIIFTGVDFFPDQTFVVLFCIAVLISSFCCVSVLLTLKRPRPGQPQNPRMNGEDGKTKTARGRTVENQQKVKAFRVISRILLSILICYLPLVSAYFMKSAKMDKTLYTCVAFPVILSLTMITVVILPLVRMCNKNKMTKCFLKLREQLKQ